MSNPFRRESRARKQAASGDVNWVAGLSKPSQGWRGGCHDLNTSSHGDLSQGRLAMRLTVCRNRWIRAAVLAAWVLASGCQRLPYIDQIQAGPS